jgi:hypothetical protein
MGATVGIGRGRGTADIFRTTYQDPLRKRVAGIVDPLGKKRDAGTLTYDEVVKGQTELEAAIAEFEKDSKLFEGLGGANATVVKKARTTLDPIIATWRNTFAQDLAKLPKPEVKPEIPAPSEEAPTKETILGGLATPQKKRKPADPPRRTVLGGMYGEGRQKPRTLLGY